MYDFLHLQQELVSWKINSVKVHNVSAIYIMEYEYVIGIEKSNLLKYVYPFILWYLSYCMYYYYVIEFIARMIKNTILGKELLHLQDWNLG